MAQSKVNKQQTKSIQRRDLPLTILAWIGVIGVFFFVIQHVWHTVIVLIFACVIAYLLFPAIKFLGKFMPRFLAILIIYLLLICGFGTFLYLFLRAAIFQINTLISTIHKLFISGTPNPTTPIFRFFNGIGLPHSAVSAMGQDLIKYFEQFAGNILPFIGNFLDFLLSTALVVVISIYLLIDGERIVRWISDTRNVPKVYRSKVQFFVTVSHQVVGGYLRGQLVLALIIGILVGLGMILFHVPYALLLGLLAFIMEFVPTLGTFISGATCVLLAIPQGWLIALLVLIYFIGVHVIESDIVGPRIIGKAIGIRPLVSLLAILVATELFGIYGAIFAAPIIGLLQAIFIAAWKDWKKLHSEEF